MREFESWAVANGEREGNELYNTNIHTRRRKRENATVVIII